MIEEHYKFGEPWQTSKSGESSWDEFERQDMFYGLIPGPQWDRGPQKGATPRQAESMQAGWDKLLAKARRDADNIRQEALTPMDADEVRRLINIMKGRNNDRQSTDND